MQDLNLNFNNPETYPNRYCITSWNEECTECTQEIKWNNSDLLDAKCITTLNFENGTGSEVYSFYENDGIKLKETYTIKYTKQEDGSWKALKEVED